MATKTLVTCDRCGALLDPRSKSACPKNSRLVLTALDHEWVNADKDLCEDCWKSFRAWFMELKKEDDA